MQSHYHRISRSCVLIGVRRDTGAIEVIATDVKPSVLAAVEIDKAVYEATAISKPLSIVGTPKRHAEPEKVSPVKKEKAPKEPKVEPVVVVAADEPIVVIETGPIGNPGESGEAELNLG